MKLAFLALLVSASAFAKTPVEVENGIIHRPLKGTNATAAYGTLKNTSSEPVVLSIVSAEAFKAAELHQTTSEGGMAKMSKMENVRIEPGSAFELKPGGNHVMLFDPSRVIKENEELKIFFLNGKEKFSLNFKVTTRASESHAHHH